MDKKALTEGFPALFTELLCQEGALYPSGCWREGIRTWFGKEGNAMLEQPFSVKTVKYH